jgi:hypothetical protein
LDPGWKKIGSGINIPDPQHRHCVDRNFVKYFFFSLFARMTPIRMNFLNRNPESAKMYLIQQQSLHGQAWVFTAQCCGSGAFLTLGSGFRDGQKNQDPDPGLTTRIMFLGENT